VQIYRFNFEERLNLPQPWKERQTPLLANKLIVGQQLFMCTGIKPVNCRWRKLGGHWSRFGNSYMLLKKQLLLLLIRWVE